MPRSSSQHASHSLSTISKRRRVAIVAAGAGARGAYEAGALSVLVPWLCEHDAAPSIFVGTSAGAINAAMFAAVADLDPHEGATRVLDVWRLVSARKVFRSPAVSLPLQTVPRYVGQLLGDRRYHVVSLLDTAPLRETAQTVFGPYAAELRNNIHGPKPVVDALAVTATDDRERTTVFVDTRSPKHVPATDQGRAIDYRKAEISVAHVLASAAIPVLFSPVEVEGRWFTDGGVRLNAPLKPAIALGATDLAVVATLPDRYPSRPGTPPANNLAPGVVDGIAALLGTTLADRMVEDIRTLNTVNELVGSSRSRVGRRRIPYLFVGPKTRHELGELAARVYDERLSGLKALRKPDFLALHTLLGRREEGTEDLLSYLFFDRAFIDAAIELGVRHAKKAISRKRPWNDARAR